MTTKQTSRIGVTVLVAAAFGVFMTLAQSTQAQAPMDMHEGHSGMMDGSGMMDQMDTVQMNRMMERCNDQMARMPHPAPGMPHPAPGQIDTPSGSPPPSGSG